MAELIPAVFNWSGGKDSTLALHYILHQQEFEVRYLLTTVNDAFDRVAMHGVRATLLLKQADALNIPLVQVRLPEMPDMESYETAINAQFEKLISVGIGHSIFGDIFLEDLKAYREAQLAKIGMKAVFPLWKRNSLELVKEFIQLGYQTIVVCAKDGLQDFCGRVIDDSFLADLPVDVDPCGENGEFHTFVFDGPIFNKRIDFELGEKVFKTFPNPDQSEMPSGYWYIDLIPV
ncbi:diphthine--ammonia ligase [Pedobacter sp. Hv1]|uniref:Dph6-related ATP pyrophosphatase n=1 Tax=Pedobacter sp. Hv1 TaxID=1740090 RepID=UPI0006D8C17A|nr:diphthine--ammonia ligase [Pedobacter sp. Hv1]KQC00989.1 ATP-binding protein [Pedobacter sp. Hv1]